MAENPTQVPTVEGPRSFAVLLQQLQDGALHPELSDLMQKLVLSLMKHTAHFGKATGELTLNLKLVMASDFTIDITDKVTVKEPKTGRPRSVMWVTPSGNLSPENPRQLPLKPRAIETPKEPVRDAPQPQAARSV